MRSHARRKQWAKVWQPKPGNQVAETAARKTLREAAKAQAQQLGPTGLENLGKVIKKMKQKAPVQMGGLANSSKIWMKPVFKG